MAFAIVQGGWREGKVEAAQEVFRAVLHGDFINRGRVSPRA